MELVEIFETLVKIPSPSLHEEKVSEKIIELVQKKEISIRKDNYGNLYIKVNPTDVTKKPLILSAHMDVVGDDSVVNLVYSGNFIETDKKRTLGADDKAGVAVALKLAFDISKTDISHGGLEIVLTRDEEYTMTGIENVEFDSLVGEDILVLDSDTLGNFEISGAGYTKLTLSVLTSKGGHSGIDIDDETRLNAAKLISELLYEIPQGVYKKDELGVITSINLGSIVSGGVDNSIYAAVENKINRADASKYVCFNSMSNLINTKAFAHYSLRSSDKAYENELIDKIQKIIEKFNKKYGELAKAELEVKEHMPIFQKSDNKKAIETAKVVGKKVGIDVYVQSFHAGAETHIYANKKNKNDITFRPVLVGVANIENMHSPDEKIDVESFKKGYNFVREFFIEYNK